MMIPANTTLSSFLVVCALVFGHGHVASAQSGNCCRLGEICEGGDVNNAADWCADSRTGQCAVSAATCSTADDCDPGICIGGTGDSCTDDNDCTQPEICQDNSTCGIRSGTACTTDPDCTVTYDRGDGVTLTETCQSDGFCGYSCHRTYAVPAPLDPSGFCPTAPGAACVGFQDCILDDCPQKVCSDDFVTCTDDGDCTAGTCSVSGAPCHRNIDCPPGNCSASPNQLCRDDDECPTPFTFCNNPVFETCVGGASCDPHQCVGDQPFCEVTDQLTCEDTLGGFWQSGSTDCAPPGTPPGENVCFVGACCTDDQIGPGCKDTAPFNTVNGCADWDGCGEETCGSLFIPGASCAADPCPVCEIESEDNCQLFNAATSIILRCDLASGTSIPNWRCADDFVSATTAALDRICWWPAFAPVSANAPECSQPGDAPADAFRLRLYPDLGHIPDEGNELGPVGGQPLNVDLKAPVLGRVWQYSAPLDTPISLEANECYWLEIAGEGTEICDIFWATSDRGNDFAMQDFNFPDFGRYTSEDASNADFAWCVSTGIVSTSPTNSGCPDVVGACCACGCPGEEPICQETTLDGCAVVDGCTGYSGKWKIYRRCDTDGNGTGDGAKCWMDTDCDSSPGVGDGVCTVPEGGQCGINPCGGEPPNDDCENAIVITHPDNDGNNDIVVCNDIRCATTDGPPTNCAIGAGDLSFDVWYRYTPPPFDGGTITIQSCNSLPIYDGFGAAYLMNDFTPGNECAEIVAGGATDASCNDDGCGAGGPWNYQIEACHGDDVLIRMGGWYDGDPGNYARSVDEGCFELHLDSNAGISCDFFLGEPRTAPFPHDRRKNRYISFDPNKAENDGRSVAFKVELLSINMGSCDDNTGAQGGSVDFCRVDRGADDCNSCSGSGAACINALIDCVPGESCEPTGAVCVNDAPVVGGSNVGRVWWVGPEHPANNGVHLMVSEPFRKVSTNWPNPTHVGDCEVAPQTVYGVRAIDMDTSAESDELVVETTRFPPWSPPAPFWLGDCVGQLRWHCNGDIREPLCTDSGDCGGDPCERAWELPDGVVGTDDLTATLWTMAPVAGVTVSAHITWVDMHGNGSFLPGSQYYDPPNFVINASDLQQSIAGFVGSPYKGYDPADCPDEPDWP